MTGIEKIKSMIAEESQKRCEMILSNGAAEVKNILSSSRKEAAKISDKIVRKAEKEAELISLKAKSEAEAITRNRFLDICNAILNDIISASYEEIEKMNDEEYFDLIKKLFVKNSDLGECTMFFNGFDLGRLPEDFEIKLNSEIFEKGAVYISKQAIDIENGFILSYGNVQVNCTFRSIFDENMERLKDMLFSYLFGGNLK